MTHSESSQRPVKRRRLLAAGAGLALVVYVDATLTGIRFHIGPHR